jgi:hypothetical protein
MANKRYGQLPQKKSSNLKLTLSLTLLCIKDKQSSEDDNDYYQNQKKISRLNSIINS